MSPKRYAMRLPSRKGVGAKTPLHRYERGSYKRRSPIKALDRSYLENRAPGHFASLVMSSRNKCAASRFESAGRS